MLAGWMVFLCLSSFAASGVEPVPNDPAMSERYHALQAWYQRLSEKRPGPQAKPEEVENFNKECGEYKAAVEAYDKAVALSKSASPATSAPQDQAARDRAEIEAMKKRLEEQRGQVSNVTFAEPPYGKPGTLGVHVLKVKGKILKATERAELLEMAPDSGAVFMLASGWENEPLLGPGDSRTTMRQILFIIGSSSYTEGDTFEDVIYPVVSTPFTNQIGMRMMVYYYATSPRLARQLKENDPSARRGKSTGTGFFITGNGHLVTNWHVVRKAKRLQVRAGGETYEGKLLSADKANDLAVIKVDAHPACLPIAPSRGVALGDDVFTIGFPDCEVQGVKPKLTQGSISSLSGIRDDPRHFQISVPVQPGNSGGGLVDSKGNVVGIVSATLNASAVLRQTGSIPQNVNYAIKSSLLLALLENNPEIARDLPTPHQRQRASKSEVIHDVETASAMVIAE